MDKKTIWLCHFSSSDIWDTCSEEFSSREEAIQFGMEEAKEWGDEQFHVGTKEDLDSIIWFDAERILERIQENAYDEAGEAADDYLDDVTKEQIAELQNMLDDVLKEWFTKHRYYPAFYAVDNIETIEVR